MAAVGVREIARDLGLSPGNVSYHYPTNEALLLAPSATLCAPDSDPAGRLELHLRAALAQLLPYCTPSGRRKLEARLDS